MTEQTSTEASTDNALVVEKFLNALQDQDFDTFESLLDANIVYENVGLPTVRGGARVAKMMRGMQGRMGFEVKFHRNVAEGATVLNERTDAIVLGPLRLQFWVCGVFEVQDGRITLWRDYFDMFDMVKATVRGVLGVAVPALRPTM
ncbi:MULTISPECIES: limonene-1,2-epoxide hydrolase family protein [unclassified Mycobacterium]|uniref:limonene-1,2-epoxide hydrolase family protein n=1 Tax=unclassified Mycobacterium TaxID=2642494 RepID=UPI0029C757EA|nr:MULTISPECIES: limonene-1,2-epoxide hydrolase family protein [unclassified Mycobacterium]